MPLDLPRMEITLLLFIAYTLVVYNWAYSSGERGGILRKFSRKGWVCKTYEGELAMTTVPGVMPEQWNFTVRDDSVAARVTAVLVIVCAPLVNHPMPL